MEDEEIFYEKRKEQELLERIKGIIDSYSYDNTILSEDFDDLAKDIFNAVKP